MILDLQADLRIYCFHAVIYDSCSDLIDLMTCVRDLKSCRAPCVHQFTECKNLYTRWLFYKRMSGQVMIMIMMKGQAAELHDHTPVK